MSALINNIIFADNAFGTIGSGLAVGDTALTFTSGHGARFPTVTGSQVLYCCILNATNVIEEIKITAHAAGSDSATITRGVGGTTAKAWNAGDRIEARVSSSALGDAVGGFVPTVGTSTISGDLTITGTATAAAAAVAGPLTVGGTATIAAAVIGTASATLLTVPTQAAADNSTKAASTAYADRYATTLGTEQATNSGTAKDFTGFPSGTKRIVLTPVGVSTSGNSPWLLQLGDAGGIEPSGYSGAGTNLGGGGTTANNTAGFIINSTLSSYVIHGSVTLSLENSVTNTWVASGTLGASDSAVVFMTGGSKSLSQELTQIRLTTVNGTDTFDAGVVNIQYSL